MSGRIFAVPCVLVTLCLVLLAGTWQASADPARLRERDRDRTWLRECADMERDRDRDQDRTQLRECGDTDRDRDRLRDEDQSRDRDRLRQQDRTRNHESLSEYVELYQKNRYHEQRRYRSRSGSVESSSENGPNYRWQKRHRTGRSG